MSLAPWLIPSGGGPFQVVVSSVVLGSGGHLQVNEGVVLTGVLDSVDVHASNTVENVASVGQRLAHYVVVESETSLKLVEILKARGRNFLADICCRCDYAKVVLTRGEQSWSFVGLVGEYLEQIRSGKSCGVLTLLQVHFGENNPVYG
jgi:hypothetical protein